jgi:pimeloyl-ACP methyl ester carboxylesterase
MKRVISTDGTPIAFERSGNGDPVILVDGALCSRSFGPMAKLAPLLAPHFTVFTYDRRGRNDSGDTLPYAIEREMEDLDALIHEAGGSACVLGLSSGAALALEAANRRLAIKKLALYEAPFIVDASRPPLPDDYLTRLNELIASDRRGDAVKMFMKTVGVPAVFIAMMRLMPIWKKLKAVAHTLPYDISIVKENQRGKPLSPGRWASVTVPTLVVDGGKSPAWIRHATKAVADALPNAQHRTLEGQTHNVAATALSPVLMEFFAAQQVVQHH